jgi:hypothetical protein
LATGFLPEVHPKPAAQFDPGIGRPEREVIFTVLADSLDEARQQFRASGSPDSDALFIIKTDTEICLA